MGKYKAIKCRFIEPIGQMLRICWNDENGKFQCKWIPNPVYPLDMDIKEFDMEGLRRIHNLPINSIGLHQKFNTLSGRPEPGDMFWRYPHKKWLDSLFAWDNHPGKELIVILPNGMEWNIDGRASNCTLPGDNLHRCWIRSGEPPNITVMRTGQPVGGEGGTCRAGASSIQAGDYHGFLKNGTLTAG